MGINLHAGISYLLSRYDTWKDFHEKSVLMLGVQSLSFDYRAFVNALNNMGFLYRNIDLETEAMNSYYMFKMLGFKKVDAIDVSDYEGANIITDLNKPIPKGLYNKYDVIFDGGTLEHLFNVYQGITNVGRMLKCNGFVIHDSPGANWNGHGFYSFSSDFYKDYYTINKWKINELYLAQVDKKETLFRSMDLRMADEKRFIQNKLDVRKERLLLVCVAEKKNDSKTGIVPKQSRYVVLHNDHQ